VVAVATVAYPIAAGTSSVGGDENFYTTALIENAQLAGTGC
jgi:hypothetical protein